MNRLSLSTFPRPIFSHDVSMEQRLMGRRDEGNWRVMDKNYLWLRFVCRSVFILFLAFYVMLTWRFAFGPRRATSVKTLAPHCVTTVVSDDFPSGCMLRLEGPKARDDMEGVVAPGSTPRAGGGGVGQHSGDAR